jgi:hypothetical protein
MAATARETPNVSVTALFRRGNTVRTGLVAFGLTVCVLNLSYVLSRAPSAPASLRLPVTLARRQLIGARVAGLAGNADVRTPAPATAAAASIPAAPVAMASKTALTATWEDDGGAGTPFSAETAVWAAPPRQQPAQGVARPATAPTTAEGAPSKAIPGAVGDVSARAAGAPAPASPAFSMGAGFAIQNEDPALDRTQRSHADAFLAAAPAFDAAWARYKRLHREYTESFRGGLALGAERMRGAIVLQPAGQLANRVMAAVSCALLGLLTDRAVYISFRSGYYASLGDMFEDAGIPWDADGVPAGVISQSGGSIMLSEPYPPAPFTEALACKDLMSALADHALLHVASNQYFVPLMAHNPHYAADMAALFPDGDIFGPLARQLFRPAAAVVAMKDAFKARVGWEGRHVVGLQVRTGGDFTDRAFGQEDWDLLLACGQAMLPPGVDPSRVAYFVATDIEWSREQAITQLARAGAAVWEFGEFMRSNTPLGCQQALVDILLLSEANDLLTTPWSTFGYFAAGLTRKRPVLMTQLMPREGGPPLPTAHQEIAAKGEPTYNGVPMHVDMRTGCARTPTPEPCFHFLPKFGVQGLSCYDAAANPWLEAEMRGGRYC